MSETAARILGILKRNVLCFANEARLHDAICILFLEAGINFVHEYRLDEKNRIDFYIPEFRIGIESKVKGSKMQTLRQLARYAEFDEIGELIVVTTKLGHSFPSTLCDKPLIACHLLRSLC